MEKFAALFGLLVVFGLAFWWQSSVWNECRADGKSVMYCMNMIRK